MTACSVAGRATKVITKKWPTMNNLMLLAELSTTPIAHPVVYG